MSTDEARAALREYLRLRGDVERFQRALAALGTVQEVRSSATDQLGRLAYETHKRFLEAEDRLIRLLAHAPDVLSSCGEIELDPNATSART